MNLIENILFGIACDYPSISENQMWLAYNKTCVFFVKPQPDVNYFSVLRKECARIHKTAKKIKCYIRTIGKIMCVYKRSIDRVWSPPDGVGYLSLRNEYQ